MHSFLKFLALFGLVGLLLVFLFGTGGYPGLVLTAWVATFVAERLTREGRLASGPWLRPRLSTVVYSAAGALWIGAGFTANLYLLSVGISITGSPQDVPQFNLPLVFLRCFLVADLSVLVLLMFLRRRESGAPAPQARS